MKITRNLFILALLAIFGNTGLSAQSTDDNSLFLEDPRDMDFSKRITNNGTFYQTGPLIVLSTAGKECRTLEKDFIFSFIQPEMIESIHIRKDKSALAEYGEAAKNGVLEIELKNGVFKELPELLKNKFEKT